MGYQPKGSSTARDPQPAPHQIKGGWAKTEEKIFTLEDFKAVNGPPAMQQKTEAFEGRGDRKTDRSTRGAGGEEAEREMQEPREA